MIYHYYFFLNISEPSVADKIVFYKKKRVDFHWKRIWFLPIVGWMWAVANLLYYTINTVIQSSFILLRLIYFASNKYNNYYWNSVLYFFIPWSVFVFKLYFFQLFFQIDEEIDCRGSVGIKSISLRVFLKIF